MSALLVRVNVVGDEIREISAGPTTEFCRNCEDLLLL